MPFWHFLFDELMGKRLVAFEACLTQCIVVKLRVIETEHSLRNWLQTFVANVP